MMKLFRIQLGTGWVFVLAADAIIAIKTVLAETGHDAISDIVDYSERGPCILPESWQSEGAP